MLLGGWQQYIQNALPRVFCMQFLFVFICSLAYSYFLKECGVTYGDSLVTIFFLATMSGIFFLNYFSLNKIDTDRPLLLSLVGITVFFYLGIIIGLYLSDANSQTVWMADSYKLHIPEADKVVHFFSGQDFDFNKILTKPGTTTHFTQGIGFLIFGKSIYSTLAVLCLVKIATCVTIFVFAKELFNKKIAYFGSLIYILSPTVMFYTVTLYKESVIHLLVILTYYMIYRMFIKEKLPFTFLLIVILFLLSRERFYLVFTFVPTIFLFLFSGGVKKIYKIGIGVFILGLIFYSNVYLQQSPSWIIGRFVDFRNSHSHFPDVMNEYNYDIPYFVAFFKILLTPFFAFNKFKMFYDFSYLLIWGSFINQAIIIMASIAFLFSLKRKFLLHLGLGLPFILFLLAAAYISPWSGRLRDSYYPLISIYAAVFICGDSIDKLKRMFRTAKNFCLRKSVDKHD